MTGSYAGASEVLLNINGSRAMLGEDEAVSLTVAGMLDSREGVYTLKYADERGDGDDSQTEIVVENGAVFLTRTGEENAEMFFEPNKPYSSFYNTPFGKLDMMILPTMVKTDMGSDKGRIELEYVMSIAGAQIVNRLRLSYTKSAQGKDGQA